MKTVIESQDVIDYLHELILSESRKVLGAKTKEELMLLKGRTDMLHEINTHILKIVYDEES